MTNDVLLAANEEADHIQTDTEIRFFPERVKHGCDLAVTIAGTSSYVVSEALKQA